MTVLEHELYVPRDARDGMTAVVLLHGRGSNRADLFGLQPHLPATWAVVAPDAPFAGADWGYGGGYAWYQFMGRNRPEPDSFRTSLEKVDALLDALPSLLGVTPGRIVLGGFSQGGTVSLAYALTRPGRVQDVLNFSGFLADHPDVHATAESVRGTRIFWGHGVADASIPFALAIEGRALLNDAGADLTARDYNVGHTIDGGELRDAIDFVRAGEASGAEAGGSGGGAQ